MEAIVKHKEYNDEKGRYVLTCQSEEGKEFPVYEKGKADWFPDREQFEAIRKEDVIEVSKNGKYYNFVKRTGKVRQHPYETGAGLTDGQILDIEMQKLGVRYAWAYKCAQKAFANEKINIRVSDATLAKAAECIFNKVR